MKAKLFFFIIIGMFILGTVSCGVGGRSAGDGGIPGADVRDDSYILVDGGGNGDNWLIVRPCQYNDSHGTVTIRYPDITYTETFSNRRGECHPFECPIPDLECSRECSGECHGGDCCEARCIKGGPSSGPSGGGYISARKQVEGNDCEIANDSSISVGWTADGEWWGGAPNVYTQDCGHYQDLEAPHEQSIQDQGDSYRITFHVEEMITFACRPDCPDCQDRKHGVLDAEFVILKD